MPFSGASDARANNQLNVEWRGVASTAPANYYFGVSTTAPTDMNGTGITEPTASDYARVAVPRNTSSFDVPSDRQIANAVDIVLIDGADHTEDWGTLVFVPVYSALSGGTYVGGYEITPRDAGPGSDVKISAGEFVVVA